MLLKKNKVTQEFGEAKAINKNTIEVNGNIYHGDNLIIASGSVPIDLALPGFKEARESGLLIDSTKILDLKAIPKSLAVIGGGVIGIEFGCLFAALGTKVTVIEGTDNILPMLDNDVIKEMTKTVKSTYNIEVITKAMVKEIKGKELFYEVDGKKQSIKAQFVLESVGRKTVVTGFDNIGLEMNERKHIVANEYGETNLPGVYAIGDVVGKSMLAQVAQHAAIVTANRVAMKYNKDGAHEMHMDYAKVPSCIYTHPEIAMIGKTEQALKAEGVDYKAFKFPFAAIGKALADDSTEGFVKLICDPVYKTILGAHIIGNRATDMISEITSVIECEEGEEEKIQTVANILVERQLAKPIIIVQKKSSVQKTLNSNVEVIVMEELDKTNFINEFMNIRKDKTNLEQATKVMNIAAYVGAMYVKLKLADAMLCGITFTTADTLRPALQIIKTSPSVSLAASVFIMRKDDVNVIFTDCALNIKPTSQQLADITKMTVNFAKKIQVKNPEAALLSYSTAGSGAGEDVDRVRQAVEILENEKVDFSFGGEIQFDAA
ncbi:hypothetical protein FQR65_LT19891 [Abscondita terminalis]|nr:hypothetical protein FQR65_LT19891 [Abscondita terminalis]